MPPPWIRSRGRKTRGDGPDSKSSPPTPPKRDEDEEEEEAERGAVGGGASPRISAAPRAAGEHGRERRPRQQLPDPRAC